MKDEMNEDKQPGGLLNVKGDPERDVD